MDSPIATVLDVRDRQALVRVSAAVCPRCAAGKGCGAGLLSPSNSERTLTVRVDAQLDVTAGDRVTLAVADQDILRAALYVYGGPLAGFLAGAGLSAALAGPGDVAAVFWALLGLAAGGIAGAILARRDRCTGTLQATISGHAAPAADVR